MLNTMFVSILYLVTNYATEIIVLNGQDKNFKIGQTKLHRGLVIKFRFKALAIEILKLVRLHKWQYLLIDN